MIPYTNRLICSLKLSNQLLEVITLEWMTRDHLLVGGGNDHCTDDLLFYWFRLQKLRATKKPLEIWSIKLGLSKLGNMCEMTTML